MKAESIFFSLILTIYIGSPTLAFSQKLSGKVAFVLSRCDSIILTSNKNSNAISGDLILKNGTLNEDLVRKRVKLQPEQRKRLRKIFARKPNEPQFEATTCFEPHHTIAVFYQGQCYPIEVCFDCSQTRQPSNIELTIFDFDERKWRELSDFFSSCGLIPF